jgi:hypothetical protein
VANTSRRNRAPTSENEEIENPLNLLKVHELPREVRRMLAFKEKPKVSTATKKKKRV